MLRTELPHWRAGPGSIAHEYLSSWERIERDTHLDAGELRAEVARQIEDAMGPSSEPSSTGFAPAAISLLTEHCDLMPGFGLLMPLPIGVAVALRPAAGDLPPGWNAEGPVFRLDPRRGCSPRQPWCNVLLTALHELTDGDVPAFDVAVRCSQDEPMSVACVASTLISFCRALEDAGYLKKINREVLESCHGTLVSALGFQVNVASILGAHAVESDKLALVDTHTFETTTLDLPDRKRVGWGLIQIGRTGTVPSHLLADRQDKVERALSFLRRSDRWRITSLRDLEHRDLAAALDMLPADLGRVVRYAVSENARVQKTVFAIRKNDWQFVGALLLMSHAALRDDLGLGSTETDFVVTEANHIEGVYGARRVGRSFFGNIICMGQAFSVLKFLDHIAPAYEERFAAEPHTVLL